MRLARQLLLALWAGVLVSVGALLAPALFAIVAERPLAGRIAAELFHRTTLLSVALALALLIVGAALPAPRARLERLAPLAPAALLVLSDVAVRPLIEAARLTAGVESTAFAAWHGVSGALYVLAAASVLWLLGRALRAAG